MSKYKEVLEIGRLLTNKEEKELFSLFFNRVNFEFIDKENFLAGIRYRDRCFTIAFSEEYFKLKEEWKVGILAHELLHLIYKHPLVLKDKIKDVLWQISTDLFINQIVLKIFPNSIPDKDPRGVFIEDFIKEGILSESDRNKDSHYYHNKLKNLNDNKKNKLQSILDNIDCNHDWSFIEDMDDLEIQAQLENIDNQLKKIGNVSGLFKDYNPIKKRSKIDYKTIIQQFLNNSFKTIQNYSYGYKNKRYNDFPGSFEEEFPCLLFTIDTSGSMSDKDIDEVFDQIDKVYEIGCDVDIIEADTTIKKFYNYKGVRPTVINGRGGTDFNDAIRYYNKHHNKYGAMIYLSDGEGSTPKVRSINNLLWILTSTTSCTPESLKQNNFQGKVIKIN